MKRKIISILLFTFLSSILITSFAATDNVIVRVGYPRLGENQNVGTVRIYESEATIDSIQLGDVFTIFVDNAEFMGNLNLIERGRFDLNVLSGGNNGDRYITYEFVQSNPARTGRVVIDFVFDNMRVLGGDVTARVDSLQSGVTSGYFSLEGTIDPKKIEEEKIKEEKVIITTQQIQEALKNNVNIIVNNAEYQILLPNLFLQQETIKKLVTDKNNLKVEVKREKPENIKYLTEVYSVSFIILDENNEVKEEIKDFEKYYYLKVKDNNINDKRNVKGVGINDSQETLLFTHYDANSDFILIQINDFYKKISIIRASNMRELLFSEGEYALFNGEKYIPLRQSASYYGWDVVWNPFTRMVNLQKEGKNLEIKDYIIVRERSFVSLDFLRNNLDVPVFQLEKQVVLKHK